MGVVSQRIDLEQPEHVDSGFSSILHARRSSSRRCRAGFTILVTEKNCRLPVVQLWVWSSQIRWSSGKGLYTGRHGKAPAQCPCIRLAALHGAPWTYMLQLIGIGGCFT